MRTDHYYHFPLPEGKPYCHNDANALCMGGRVVGPGLACQLVDIFLNTEFEGGRHEKRIAKLMAIENR